MKQFQLSQLDSYLDICQRSYSSLLEKPVVLYQMPLDLFPTLVLRFGKMLYLSLNQELNQLHKPSIAYLELMPFYSSPFYLILNFLSLSKLNTSILDDNTSFVTNYLNPETIKITESGERKLSRFDVGGQLPKGSTQSAIAPFNLFGFCESPPSLSKQLSLKKYFQKAIAGNLLFLSSLLAHIPYLTTSRSAEQNFLYTSNFCLPLSNNGHMTNLHFLLKEFCLCSILVTHHMSQVLIKLLYILLNCYYIIIYHVFYETNVTKWRLFFKLNLLKFLNNFIFVEQPPLPFNQEVLRK